MIGRLKRNYDDFLQSNKSKVIPTWDQYFDYMRNASTLEKRHQILRDLHSNLAMMDVDDAYTRSKYQLITHAAGSRALIPKTYGDLLKTNELEIRRVNGIDPRKRICPYVILGMARRMGKTEGGLQLVASILVSFPNFHVIVISPGARQSLEFMMGVKRILETKLKFHAYHSNQERLTIEKSPSDIRRLDCYPASAGDRYVYCFLSSLFTHTPGIHKKMIHIHGTISGYQFHYDIDGMYTLTKHERLNHIFEDYTFTSDQQEGIISLELRIARGKVCRHVVIVNKEEYVKYTEVYTPQKGLLSLHLQIHDKLVSYG